MQLSVMDWNELVSSRSKEAVGRRLELTRRIYGLQQGEFARRAGLNQSTYNQYEKGVNMPNLSAAFALVDTYRLTLDWIYDGAIGELRYEDASAIEQMFHRLRSTSA